MKKITFEDLCRLVSEVDYINPYSYPIVFEVEGVDFEFCVGIGDLYHKESGDLIQDLQYLLGFPSNGEDCTFFDVQDPDMMIYEEIVSMLKKQCNANEDSIIWLYDEESLNGAQLYDINWNECSKEVKEKFKN